MQSLQAAATASVLSSGVSVSPAASRALDVVRDVDASASLPPEGRRMLLDLATQLQQEKEQGERLRLRLARSAKELEESRAYAATLKDALAIRAKDFGFLSDNAVEGMRLLNLMQSSLTREREEHAATKEEAASLERRLTSCKDTLTDVLSTLQASAHKIRDLNSQLDAWALVAKRCEEVTGESLTVALFDKLRYVFEFYVDVSWELGIQGSFQNDTLPQVKAKSVSLLRELKTRLSHAEQLATTLKAEKEDLEVVNADLVEAVANQEDILASTLAAGQATMAASSGGAESAEPASPPAARETDFDLEGIEKLVTENIELKETVQSLQTALERARREQQYQGATIERLNSTNGAYKAKLDELVRDNVLLSTEIRKSAVLRSQGPAEGVTAVEEVVSSLPSGGSESDIPAPRRSAVEPDAGQGTAGSPHSEQDDSPAYMSLTGSVVNTKREARAQSRAGSVGKSGILDLLEEQEAALKQDATRQEERALKNSQVVTSAPPAQSESIPLAQEPRGVVPEDFFEQPGQSEAPAPANPPKGHDLLLSLSGDDNEGEVVIQTAGSSAEETVGASRESGVMPASAEPQGELSFKEARQNDSTESMAVQRAKEITQRLQALGAEIPDELLSLAKG